MSFVPTAAAVLNQWVKILGALEKKINRQSFETWLKPTRFSRVVEKTLYVRIPTADFEHIGDKYGQLIEEAIERLGLEIDEVVFETPAQDPGRAPRPRGRRLCPACPATPPTRPAAQHRGNTGTGPRPLAPRRRP